MFVKQPVLNTNTSIVFPDKAYVDAHGDTDFVSIKGRWGGDGVGYKNNLTRIICYKSERQCLFYDAEQIGVNQIDLGLPTNIPIKQWDDSVISASDIGTDGGFLCVRNTINIDRKNGSAELVTESINQSALNCVKADNKTYKWTMEGSLYWDSFRERTKTHAT